MCSVPTATWLGGRAIHLYDAHRVLAVIKPLIENLENGQHGRNLAVGIFA